MASTSATRSELEREELHDDIQRIKLALAVAGQSPGDDELSSGSSSGSDNEDVLYMETGDANAPNSGYGCEHALMSESELSKRVLPIIGSSIQNQ